MRDYISRETALKIIYTSTAPALEVKAMPAADVVEVATTSWEDIERIGFGSWEATCKHCKRRMMYMAWWKYCPECGAKVEETRKKQYEI